MFFRRLSTVVAAVAAVVACGTAVAQEVEPTQLDTVIVSAAKSPAGSASIVQAVTVITGAELRATGVSRVSEALRLVPGAAVVGSGPVGSVTSLFLRGGESRYTKVLVDGVAVNTVGGFFDFSHLTTDNVERIEIVRGPASVVHGADAMTGVVHVITRRGAGPPAIEADVRGGTYGTLDATGAALGEARGVQYSFGAARQYTDGILPFNNEYANRTLSGALRFEPLPATTLDLSARYGSARYHYPHDVFGFVVDSNAYRDQNRLTLALDGARRVTDRVQLRLLAGSNGVTDLTDDVGPPPPWEPPGPDRHTEYRVRTNRRNAELRASFHLPIAVVTSGVEYVHERERTVASEGPVDGPLSPTSTFAGSRNTRVGFAEVAGALRRIDYVVSGRVDRPSDFGSFGTYRAGVATSFGGLRLRANAGTAFNAPAFSQLLPTEFTVGSPDLEPERVRAVEAGVDWSMAGERLRFGITRFDQRFLDLIQFVGGGPPDFLGSFANLTEARSRGWEADVRLVPIPGWVLASSFTHVNARVSRLDARYSGSLEVGQPLIRRPRRMASAALNYVHGEGGTLGVSVRRVGSRPDLDFREFPSPTVRLPAYTVTDLSGGLPVLRGLTGGALSLTVRVENLFDEKYEEVLYYEAPGRTILVGGKATWRLPR